MMSTGLVWLLWVVAVVFGLLFLLYLYLIVQKSIDIRREARFQKKRLIFASPLLAYIRAGESSRSLRHLTEIDIEVMNELLREYSHVLGGEEERRRIRELAEQILTEPFRQAMFAKRFVDRINVLYAVEEFAMASLRDDVKLRLQAEELEAVERHQLYRILAVLQDRDLFHYLSDEKLQPLPDFVYRELLLKMEEDVFEEYLEHIFTLPRELRFCVVDILGNKQDFRHMGLLEQLTRSQQREDRIRALKALARFGFVLNENNMIDKARSEAWEERMMAARVMGAAPRTAFMPVLVEMMRDSSWWVRQAAAQAILRYPNGLEKLRDIALHDTDRYARDMAVYWVEASTT